MPRGVYDRSAAKAAPAAKNAKAAKKGKKPAKKVKAAATNAAPAELTGAKKAPKNKAPKRGDNAVTVGAKVHEPPQRLVDAFAAGQTFGILACNLTALTGAVRDLSAYVDNSAVLASIKREICETVDLMSDLRVKFFSEAPENIALETEAENAQEVAPEEAPVSQPSSFVPPAPVAAGPPPFIPQNAGFVPPPAHG